MRSRSRVGRMPPRVVVGTRVAGMGVVLLTALLAGCATYHALPLPSHANLAPAASAPAMMTAAVPAILDLQRVGAIAVARDPGLATARARARVAKAHAYAAGLLPDPSLSFSLAHPFNGGAPSDHHNAWSAGLAESLVGLLTHGDVHSAASAKYAEALLGWRWQAEQVALKARITYLDAWWTRRAVRALETERKAARSALQGALKAHAAGALSAALYQQAQQQAVTARSRLQSARDREVRLEETLANMLRVRDGAHWRFRSPPAASTPSPATVKAALAALPKRRLDLLALQAGYRSADRRLRADILAQFPLLDIGFTRARDNTGVNSVGFGITLRLPIFNGNRGRIAIDRATRKALNAAYQTHLDGAENHIRATYRRLRLVRGELAAATAQLPALSQSAHAALAAQAGGALTRFQAYGAVTTWLDARINADHLRATALQLELTLRTLLAEGHAPAITQRTST